MNQYVQAFTLTNVQDISDISQRRKKVKPGSGICPKNKWMSKISTNGNNVALSVQDVTQFEH